MHRSSAGFTPSSVLSMVAVFVCLLSTVGTLFYHQRVFDRFTHYEHTRKALSEMSHITSTWISGGVQRSWTSYLQEGETIAELSARHQAEVAEIQKVFPIDPVKTEGR